MPRRRKPLVLPHAKSPFLAEFLVSLGKRSKALKHRLSELEVDRVLVEYNEGRVEMLELLFHPFSETRTPLSIGLWEDRGVDIVFSGWKDQGWDWVWKRYGVLLPTYGGKELVATIERTLSSGYRMDSASTSRFDDIWKPYLASPSELVRNL